MIKIGVADYGLNVWFGELYDYEERFLWLKEMGYEGIERLSAKTDSEAVMNAAAVKRGGMEFSTCQGQSAMQTLRWAAALNFKYVWVESNSRDFETFCRHANYQIETASRYGVSVALHNHLGSAVETQDQLKSYMEKCPGSKLILDVGHLTGADGDPLEVIDLYFDRIAAVHVKDFVYVDKNAVNWYERLRFCGLGRGEMGDLNNKIIRKLIDKGYAGWIFVEHDTHLRDAKLDMRENRDYIKKAGI